MDHIFFREKKHTSIGNWLRIQYNFNHELSFLPENALSISCYYCIAYISNCKIDVKHLKGTLCNWQTAFLVLWYGSCRLQCRQWLFLSNELLVIIAGPFGWILYKFNYIHKGSTDTRNKWRTVSYSLCYVIIFQNYLYHGVRAVPAFASMSTPMLKPVQ